MDLDRLQRIVFVYQFSVQTIAMIESMKAANIERIDEGKALAYDEGSFDDVRELLAKYTNETLGEKNE